MGRRSIRLASSSPTNRSASRPTDLPAQAEADVAQWHRAWLRRASSGWETVRRRERMQSRKLRMCPCIKVQLCWSILRSLRMDCGLTPQAARVTDVNPTLVALEADPLVSLLDDQLDAVVVLSDDAEVVRDLGEHVLRRPDGRAFERAGRSFALVGPLDQIEVVRAHVAKQAAAGAPMLPPQLDADRGIRHQRRLAHPAIIVKNLGRGRSGRRRPCRCW